MKYLNKFLIVLVTILLTTSCKTFEQKQFRKLNKAKRQVNKLLKQYPEILDSKKDTVTIVKLDTVVNQRSIVRNDTVVIESISSDTIIRNATGKYLLENEKASAFLNVTEEAIVLNITTKPITYVRVDTIYSYDTTVINTREVVIEQYVDTKPNIWLSFWYGLQKYLWLISLVFTGLFTVYVYHRITNRYADR